MDQKFLKLRELCKETESKAACVSYLLSKKVAALEPRPNLDFDDLQTLFTQMGLDCLADLLDEFESAKKNADINYQRWLKDRESLDILQREKHNYREERDRYKSAWEEFQHQDSHIGRVARKVLGIE